MIGTRGLLTSIALAGMIGTAEAQSTAANALKDLPGWKIPDICAKDSAQAHCLTLESRAWRTVSGSWVSLPDSVKRICLGNARQPADQSWRVLNDCVDTEMEKLVDKRAVATIRTPGEPVPPPKSAVTPAAIPPPILGMPIAPPPFALDAEAEAKRRAEADAKQLADAEAARKAAEAEAARSAAPVASPVAVPPPILGLPVGPPPFALDAEADARRKAEAEARAKVEAEAKAKAEAEAKAKADADARRSAEADSARKAAEAETARKVAAETEARRQAAADATRKAQADAEARRAAEADAKRKAEAEAFAKSCQDDLQKIAKAGVIRFPFGSAALDKSSSETLQKLAAATAKCPDNIVRVEAHTDSVGEPEFNEALSQRRAQTVVDSLVRLGLKAELIKAEGYGETKPIGDNNTSEGRAQNRRIEFIVVPK